MKLGNTISPRMTFILVCFAFASSPDDWGVRITEPHSQDDQDGNEEVRSVDAGQRQPLVGCGWSRDTILAEVMEPDVIQNGDQGGGHVSRVDEGRCANPSSSS